MRQNLSSALLSKTSFHLLSLVPLRPPKYACDFHREDCGGLRATFSSLLSQLFGDGQVAGSEDRLDFS